MLRRPLLPCRNPKCTNEECPDCRQIREDREAAESLEWAQKRDAQHEAERVKSWSHNRH